MKLPAILFRVIASVALFQVVVQQTGAGVEKAPAPESQEAESEPVPSVRPFILSATKAVAWRLMDASDAKNREVFKKSGAGVTLKKDQLANLQRELGDPENIGAGVHFCGFNPIVAVVFESPGHTVELQFCFSCDDVSVWLDGKNINFVPIDPGRSRLLKIIKEVFPNDDVIKSLPLEHPTAGPGKSKT